MADSALTAPDSPTIPAPLARQASTLAILAAAAGLAACWLTRSPLGLLAPVAAACLLASARAAHLLAVLALAFLIALLAAIALTASAQWPAFFGLAVLTGAIVAASGATTARPADASAVSSLIHPDDRSAAEQAAARAFWSGIPQVVSCRQRASARPAAATGSPSSGPSPDSASASRSLRSSTRPQTRGRRPRTSARPRRRSAPPG